VKTYRPRKFLTMLTKISNFCGKKKLLCFSFVIHLIVQSFGSFTWKVFREFWEWVTLWISVCSFRISACHLVFLPFAPPYWKNSAQRQFFDNISFRTHFTIKTFIYKMKLETIAYNSCRNLFFVKLIVLAYEPSKVYFNTRFGPYTSTLTRVI
jgi:hypothetical protein